MTVPEKPPIRLLLVDDHQMVLSGLRQFLAKRPGIEIVGEACDGEEAVTLTAILCPDIILMDISMPNMNGIEATREILRLFPSVRIILLTMHDEPEHLLDFADSGAHGYVLKKTSPGELLSAIDSVLKGSRFMSDGVAALKF